jgi:pimeloyl-ACP methyl ester carboxylesterase
MLGRAGMLADHGYGALLYDQRACGESEGEQRSFGWRDAADVTAAISFLSSRYGVEPDHTGILGFSQGASIGLQAAAENDQVGAVVAEEPGFFVVEDLPKFKSLYERWVTFNYRLGLIAIRKVTGISDPPGVVDALAEIPPRPILFIASHAEGDVAYILVRHYYELAEGPKEWWSVSEASHGAIPAIRPEEYESKVSSFFDEWLLDGQE